MIKYSYNFVISTLKDIKQLLKKECFNIPQGKLLRTKIGLELLDLLQIKYSYIYRDYFTIIELIHNASILHDDVIDNEIERRGHRSNNLILGNKKSVLYGNLILLNAIKRIEKFNSKPLREEIYTTIENMCIGEIKQDDSSNKMQTIEEYIERCRLKTASLFALIGKGIIILSNSKNTEYIVDFCENFGIAFQINNDLKDYKQSKSDLKNGIYTAPYIYADTLTEKESIEKTTSLVNNYIKRAVQSLHNSRDIEAKHRLIEDLQCLKD